MNRFSFFPFPPLIVSFCCGLACAVFNTPQSAHTAAQSRVCLMLSHISAVYCMRCRQTAVRDSLCSFSFTHTIESARVAHTAHGPNELFHRIAANECIRSVACVCAKRRDQLAKAGGARDWISNQRRENRCRARCGCVCTRGFRLLSIRSSMRRGCGRRFSSIVYSNKLRAFPLDSSVHSTCTPDSAKSIAEKEIQCNAEVKKIRREQLVNRWQLTLFL